MLCLQARRTAVPGGDSEPATRSHELPECLDGLLHVRHKKYAEDTEDHVERGRRQVKIEHVRNSKLDVLEPAFPCLSFGKLNQVFCKIDA